jgi:hypothetical protein
MPPVKIALFRLRKKRNTVLCIFDREGYNFGRALWQARE